MPNKKSMKSVEKEGEKEKIAVVCCKPEGKSVENIINTVKGLLKERGNVVMTRLNDQDVQKIDALVEIELFRSRSEAAAFFVHEGIQAKKDLFDKVTPAVKEIQKLKKEAREALTKVKKL